MNNTIKQKISNIAGTDGWWNSSSEKTFQIIFVQLLKAGISEDEIIDILKSVYNSVAACYGD